MFYPTMVVAIGNLAHRALQETEELLQAFRSPARHITALGAYTEGAYHRFSVPPIAESVPFESELKRWLYATRAEVNIDRAREEGIEVGPPAGYLLEQVLLVVDSNAYKHASDVLEELKSLCERADELVPARVHWLILHASYDEPLPTEITQDHQERLRQPSALQEGKLIVARLIRSDGSNMTPEQLCETVAYLLLGALHAAKFHGEHWLYRSVVDFEPSPSTLGCGLVVLPLHRMLSALQDKLVADALSAFLQSAKNPLQLPALEENALWRAITNKAAQALAAGETERIKVGDDFRVEALISPPQVSQRNPDLTQLEAIHEWETRWQQEKLPRWRTLLNQFVQEETQAYLQSLRETIHAYLRTPGADLNTVAAQLEQLATAVSGWSAHHLAVVRPSPKTKERIGKQIEEPLNKPSRRNILGIPLPVRPNVPREIAENFDHALREFYTQQVQAEAQEAFKSAAQRLLSELRQEHSSYVAAKNRIAEVIREHNERAQRFRVEALPWLEPLVYRWEHLEPAADALWGNRDLASLVARYMNPEHGLLQQLPLIVQNLQQQLQRWMTDYYRRFSYYLRELFPNHYRREQWCLTQLAKMRLQAERTLWHTEKGLPQMWQITPPAASGMQPLMPHAPDRLWESDVMLGFVAAARSAEV